MNTRRLAAFPRTTVAKVPASPTPPSPGSSATAAAVRARGPSPLDRSPRSRTSLFQTLLTALVLTALAVAAPAQQRFAELGKRHLPAGAYYTQTVAFGDVDGDGDLDLVCGNGRQQNRLYLNNGRGVFTDATATHMPVDWPQNTTCVALGDVDGDGDLDIVWGNGGPYDDQNLLYLNNGSGVFTDATAAQMPGDASWTNSVALGDVDGDGDLDLVWGNSVQNSLYLNDGSGVFTDATATQMPVHSDWTTSVALGDVDGDGDLDLVWGSLYDEQTRLYLNNGRGVFTDATGQMPVDNDETWSVALGDVDGDGDLDLVCGTAGQNRLYVNNGSGVFTDATAAQLPVGGSTLSVALGDVDGDGDLDLVCGNARQDRLYLNNGSGVFTDATAAQMPVDNDWAAAVALGDVDGDGDLDLVRGNGSGDVGIQKRLYLNNGRGVYADATAPQLPVDYDWTAAVALGDVDGDGDLDLVCGNNLNRTNWNQQNRLYVNDGSGVFTDGTAAQMPVDPDNTWSVVLGDVDGDGDLDLVCGNAGQNRLYLNDGSGVFMDATAAQMPVGGSTSSVALGDVDGDGDLDLVCGNGGQDRLYLNNGSGVFTDATAAQMPADNDWTASVALGDVDGDGDLDIVCGRRGSSGQQNRLYLNNGSGVFTDATAAQMPVDNDDTWSVALGDVDGDGDLDLVCGNGGQFRQQNRLCLNDGRGLFLEATAAQMPAHHEFTRSAALVDVDGDGDLDIVYGDTGFSGQQNRLYLNDGRGMFTDATAVQMPPSHDATNSIALGDVDGDGDLDLVCGNGSNIGQQNRIYLNVERQLDAPYLLRVGHPYQLDVYARYGQARPFDVALPYLSTTRVSIPLPPYGILGIAPMASLPPILIPQPAGVGSVTWNVPNNPALAGIAIHTQALLIQYPVQARLTNVVTDVILQ